MWKLSNLIVLFSMSLAILLVSIEYTGAPIIIPPLKKAIVLSLSQLQWVIISYLLSFTVTTIAAGKFGDIYGNKLILSIGIIMFGCASFFAGICHFYIGLIISRFMQGLAAGVIWPNSTAIVIRSAPADKKPFSIGIIAGVVGFSMAIGPAIAGWLSDYVSWRWFFLINTPLSVLLLICLCFCQKCDPEIINKRIDFFGIILFSVALFLLTITLTEAKQILHYWFLMPVMLLLVFTLFTIFFKLEKATNSPLIDTSVLANKLFVLGCSSRAIINMGFYSFLYTISLFLHNNMGFSAISSGVLLLPMTITIGLISPISGYLIKEFGARLFIIFGSILFAITYLIFTLCNTLSIYQLMFLFILPGLCYGFISPALLTLSMQNIDNKNTGTASGIFYMSSLIGSLIGVSLSTAILNNNAINKISNTNFIYVLVMCWGLSLLAMLCNILFPKPVWKR